MLKRLLRGETVGRVRGVGDGEACEARIFEAVERDRLDWAVVARPENEDSVCVWDGRADGDAGVDELLRVGGVGGEKDVLRGAVGELLGECRGGAEGSDEVDAGGVLVSGSKSGHYGLEVGGAGELELLLREEIWDEQRGSEEREEGSAHRATVL